MGACGRNREEHCCWLAGKPCPFLRTASKQVQLNDGFYWSCQLRIEHGNWDDVHTDPRYLSIVKPRWDECGIKDCGYWPRSSNSKCNVCGNE